MSEKGPIVAKTSYEFLFVGRDEGGFTENFAYDLGEGTEGSGKLFINLDIQQNAYDAERIGELIFDTMRKVFFADPEVAAYDRFEGALKEVNRVLEEYKKQRDNDFLGRISAIVAAVVGNELLLTQTGDAEAYMIRKRLVSSISDDLDDSVEEEVFTNIAAGEVEKGDVILMSTTRLLRYIAKTELGKMFERGLGAGLMEMKDYMQSEILSKVGIVGINVEDKSAQGRADHLLIHEKEEHFQELNDKSFEDQRAMPGKANPALTGKNLKGNIEKFYGKFKNKIADLNTVKWNKGLASAKDKLFSGKRKEPILLAIVGLVLILTFGVWWMRSKAEQDQMVTDLAGRLVQIKAEVDSAITTAQFNKDKAGEMLASAEAKAIEVYNSGYHKAKSREILDLILETRDSIDGVVRFDQDSLNKIADLSSKRDNVSALGLVELNDRLYAYEYNALYPIVGDEVLDPLTIDDNENVVAAVAYEDNESILFFTESDKLIEFKDERMNFLATSDGQFKNAVDIVDWSQNIYLLDPGENQVWKYTRRRDSFDAANAYSVGAEIENGVDMAIDGSIYVLGADGYITRLFKGQKEDFPIQKEPVKAVTNPTKIYTEAEMDQIFVLEPSENRILVYLKDPRSDGAVYSTQYVFDDLQDMRDMKFDKSTNTLFVLTADAVYRAVL